MTSRSTETEAMWQDTVIQAAQVMGWKFLHVRKSIGKGKKWMTATNIDGWPDLLLWHPRRGGFLALELKAGTNKPTDAQLAVLGELGAAGAEAFVAWPDDWPRVEAALKNPRGTPSPG